MSTSHQPEPFPYRTHGNCTIVPHMEIRNTVFDWGHKDPHPGRYFGRFECEECGNSWSSAWTWLGRGQKCNKCVREIGWHNTEYTDPHEVAPRRVPTGPRSERPPARKQTHYYENCEYCAELCGSTRVKPTYHACEKVRPGDPYARAYRR